MFNRIALPNLDPAQGTEDLNQLFVIWLSDIVDILNQDIDTLENAFANLITSAAIDVGGGGAGPINVTVLGLTSAGYVTATLISSTNPNITILSVVPSLNSFAITFSADPGASAIIKYTAFTSQP
jgi:hypothetical protein